MKVIITIQHPAHVHFFKHAVWALEDEGVDVRIYCREKDVAMTLLDNYDIEYEILAGDTSGLASLAKTQAVYEMKLLKRAREFDPDVLAAIAEPAVTHIANLIDSQSLLFTDTEHATLQNMLAFPFANRICTPECYSEEIGPKQFRYPGFHELAYLHPNRFEPNASIVAQEGLDPNKKIAIIRTVAWEAAHDIGQKGFDNIREVVKRIQNKEIQVVLTSEGTVPSDLEQYQFSLAPEKIHHLMAYSDLFVGESSTMAAECAVLGTPAIYVNSLELGYISELEEKYSLVKHIRNLESINQLMSYVDNIMGESYNYDSKRSKMLSDKEDTTGIILQNIKSVAEVSY
jgi:predicted glycosyltransferase